MYNIFDPKLGPDTAFANKKVIKFKHVKDTLHRSLGDVIAYYQRSNFRVSQEHVIYDMIKLLRVSTKRELNDYVRVAREKTPLIAKRLKLIHPTNESPVSVTGTFYNMYISEYLIATDNEFNIQLAWRNWKSISAVKVHSHPFNDMSMALCDGNYPTNGITDGYAVLTVNVALLALQYRAYCEELYGNNIPIGPSQIRIFIHRYVITNMLKRHVEIALINRTLSGAVQEPLMPFSKLHPIYVPDYDRRTDEVVTLRSEIINSTPMRLDILYRMFDCIWFENWLEVVKLPDMPPTRPVKWVIVLSYMRYLEFYLKGLVQVRGNLPRDVYNKVNHQIKALSVDRGMPSHVASSVHHVIENVKLLLQSV